MPVLKFKFLEERFIMDADRNVTQERYSIYECVTCGCLVTNRAAHNNDHKRREGR